MVTPATLPCKISSYIWQISCTLYIQEEKNTQNNKCIHGLFTLMITLFSIMQSQIVKIFVLYHKPEHLLKNDVYIPLHVGRANSTLSCDEMAVMEAEMPGDDTAENISAKNANYAELTGIYWVWKNYESLENLDYIGFAHYRRFMIFNLMEQEEPMVMLQNFTEAEVEYYMPQHTLLEAVRQFDLLVPKRVPVFEEEHPKQKLNLLEQWQKAHGTKHLEQALECARNIFPECSGEIDEYVNSTLGGYWWNILIARRDIFFDYCQFVFSILEEMGKTGSFENCSGYNQRMPGFIAERLTGIYIMMKLREGRIRIGEFSTLCLSNDVRHDEPTPALFTHYKYAHLLYGFLSNISFGTTRKKYRQKRRYAKDMMRHILKINNAALNRTNV